MSKVTIIKANVTATKIPFDNGICWDVNGKQYHYGWAYSKATDGEMFDVLKAPDGTVLKGDIVSVPRSGTDGQGNLVSYGSETAFQPHENQVSRKDATKWSKDDWIKCFGSDEHYYGDVESVTYKNPKSKTGRLRTDKCHSISIGADGYHVIVHRKNGRRSTMSIPLENIVERHLKNFDE